MHRKSNTNINGGQFPDEIIEAVWKKAATIKLVNPDFERKDICGAVIEKKQYGVTTENGTGWEIDHIVPVSKGGNDELSNLQPLQWQNNRHKADKYPADDYCIITANK